jgi:hypothetical protein
MRIDECPVETIAKNAKAPQSIQICFYTAV